MLATNFNLRGLPIDLMTHLKQEAKKSHSSVNALILQYVEEKTGYSRKARQHQYHDYAYLAGTWSEEETALFQKNIADFEKIDKDLWA